jgi:hypothetical protein
MLLPGGVCCTSTPEMAPARHQAQVPGWLPGVTMQLVRNRACGSVRARWQLFSHPSGCCMFVTTPLEVAVLTTSVAGGGAFWPLCAAQRTVCRPLQSCCQTCLPLPPPRGPCAVGHRRCWGAHSHATSTPRCLRLLLLE